MNWPWLCLGRLSIKQTQLHRIFHDKHLLASDYSYNISSPKIWVGYMGLPGPTSRGIYSSERGSIGLWKSLVIFWKFKEFYHFRLIFWKIAWKKMFSRDFSENFIRVLTECSMILRKNIYPWPHLIYTSHYRLKVIKFILTIQG